MGRIKSGPFICKICNRSYPSAKNLADHKYKSHISRKVKCDFCDFSTRTKSTLKIHRRRHTGDKPFKCSFEGCNYAAANIAHLRIHEGIHNGDKPFKCPHESCQYATGNRANFYRHRDKHAEESQRKRFQCFLCSRTFTENYSLTVHMRKHEGIQKTFPCQAPNCIYKADAVGNLKRHMVNFHGKERPFKCPMKNCNYASKSKEGMDRHMLGHTQSKNYKCPHPGCSYEAVCQSSIRRHTKTHTGERPFPCALCDYRGVTAGNLSIHIAAHTGEKYYKCNICEYTSSTRGALGVHIRVHTGERPYRCQMEGCGYAAKGPSCLRTHEKTHTDTNKIFECPVCSRMFKTKWTLIQHGRVHTGDKPYPCDHQGCDYRAGNRGNLKRHKLTHLDDGDENAKPFSCHLCEFRCRAKTDLERHCQRYHKGKSVKDK